MIKLSDNITIKEEVESFKYLKKYHFEKNLKKLIKKLEGKTVVLYGAGVFFEVINKYYDLSNLNIIGISDAKFKEHQPDETFLGYKVISPQELRDVNPDYVLVATKFYIKIIDSLTETFFGTDIRVRAMVKKPLLTLIREVL